MLRLASFKSALSAVPRGALTLVFGCALASQVQALDLDVQWDEDKDKNPADFVSEKFSGDMKVRGWEVSEKVYFGQAKVGGRYGPGVIVDRGDYSWGFNHRGVAFSAKF